MSAKEDYIKKNTVFVYFSLPGTKITIPTGEDVMDLLNRGLTDRSPDSTKSDYIIVMGLSADNPITITQGDDLENEFVFGCMFGYKSIKDISVKTKNNTIILKRNLGVKKGFNTFLELFKFDDPIESVTISFKYNLLSDMIIPVKTINKEASEVMTRKFAEDNKKHFMEASENFQVKHSINTDFATIYFNNSCADAGNTVVELFINESGENSSMKIQESVIKKGECRAVFDKLGFGGYRYKVSQETPYGTILFENTFYIKEPSYDKSPVYSNY